MSSAVFDRHLRALVHPLLDRPAQWLHRRDVSADTATAVGLGLGLAAAIAAGLGQWVPALGLWLASRGFDGLDGALARMVGPTPQGGFHDLMADFIVYAAFIVGVAVSVPEARLAAVATLASYYLSATALLLWSSLSNPENSKRGRETKIRISDNRTVRFLGGLAEGFETIVAYGLICLFPGAAQQILWVFAAMVALTATQRIWFGSTDLERNNRR